MTDKRKAAAGALRDIGREVAHRVVTPEMRRAGAAYNRLAFIDSAELAELEAWRDDHAIGDHWAELLELRIAELKRRRRVFVELAEELGAELEAGR